MLEFMNAGGFLMWPLLALGLTAVGLAVRGALVGGTDGEAPRRLSRACLTGSLAWSLLGLVMVTRAAAQPDSVFSMERILVVGLGEALCPAVLGLALFALVQLVPRGGALRALATTT